MSNHHHGHHSSNNNGNSFFSSSTSSSSFFSSSSSSFSNTRNGNNEEHTTGRAYTSHSYTDPNGTTVKTTRQNLGEAPVSETKRYDARGRELAGGASDNSNRRIQDVTDEEEREAGRKYEEAMEGEYAKREGGA